VQVQYADLFDADCPALPPGPASFGHSEWSDSQQRRQDRGASDPLASGEADTLQVKHRFVPSSRCASTRRWLARSSSLEATTR